MTLEVESGQRGVLPCILIDPSAFERWDGAPPDQLIPPDQQAQLLHNFKEAMEFQGLQLVVERGESSFD